MKILVANIGSTSFKYSLLEMDTEQELARGACERIGRPGSRFADHAAAVDHCLEALCGSGKPLTALHQLDAVGFKAVHAKGMTGCRKVDEELLAAMEEYALLLPAHNPPYVAAMRKSGVYLDDTLVRRFLVAMGEAAAE